MEYDDTFEWDDRKSSLNEEKHGICFSLAALIWDEDFIHGKAKTVDGEDRFIITGKLDDVFITVVFTMRGKNKRLISARRARRGERKEYYKHFPE